MKTDNCDLNYQWKPDFEQAMNRLYAWYNQNIIDRPPVQFAITISIPDTYDKADPFSATGAYPSASDNQHLSPQQWKQKWFDVELMLDSFERIARNIPFTAETFPIFWPNLGPVVYSGFFGSEIIFEETTAWAKPFVHSWDQVDNLKLHMNNEYIKKLEEMTALALEKGKGKYLVGYSDLHPGMDCVAAWRKNELFCMDLYDNPEQVQKMIDVAMNDWQRIYDHFHNILREHNQPSSTWIGLPSFGKMHVPSCDFSAMISPQHFEQFCLPILQQEVKGMTHNIFHLDGAGVAKHLDMVLSVPEIQAIQWVQGVGKDEQIMKWIDLIKKIQQAGKSVIVILDKEELNDFTSAVKPEGILLCVNSTDIEEQNKILDLVKKWT